MRAKLSGAILHPFTAVAFVVGVVGQLGFGAVEPLWGLVSTTASVWFPLVAVTSSTIMPEIGLGGIGTPLLISGAVLYALVLSDKLLAKASDYIEDKW